MNAVRSLRVNSIILDGEVCCFNEGREDFDRLWRNKHNTAAEYCAFDLMEIAGVDIRDRPLLERKRRLKCLLAAGRPGLHYVEHVEGVNTPAS